MTIHPTTIFWCVTDPTPASTIDDILFSATLPKLRLQFIGGLDAGTLTIHVDETAARAEAHARLEARR